MAEGESARLGDLTGGVEEAWTVDAFRARVAQERANELKAQAQHEQANRDQAIREAAGAGASTRELARLVGMSRPALYHVLGTKPEPGGG